MKMMQSNLYVMLDDTMDFFFKRLQWQLKFEHDDGVRAGKQAETHV